MASKALPHLAPPLLLEVGDSGAPMCCETAGFLCLTAPNPQYQSSLQLGG
jgi:hypothetical protein